MLEWKSKDSNIKIISEIHHICDVQQFTLRAKDIIFSRLDINSFRTCYVWYLDHSGYVTKPWFCINLQRSSLEAANCFFIEFGSVVILLVSFK